MKRDRVNTMDLPDDRAAVVMGHTPETKPLSRARLAVDAYSRFRRVNRSWREAFRNAWRALRN